MTEEPGALFLSWLDIVALSIYICCTRKLLI